MSKGGGRRFIADRSRAMDASGIRKVFDLASKLTDPVDLSIGQPCHDAPQPVKDSAIRAILAGRNAYTPTQGSPKLVEALERRMARAAGTEGGKVIVTPGVAGGLFLAFAAVVNPGDEVIIGDPYFVIYKQAARLFGGVPVPVDTYPGFRLTAELIEPHITPRTKIIVVGSPANPTGVLLSESDLRDIADLARRKNVLIFSDEIYAVFSYDGPACSMAGMCEDLLLFSGFSKSHAVPGWRIGYAFGPAEIIEEMAKLQQYSFVCAPSPAQAAIAENLDLDTSAVTESYRRKRDIVCEGLRGRYEFVVPGGAFYLFPKAPAGSGTEFAERAVRNNLLVVPGAVFSERDTHFRISYASNDETIRRGIEILNRMA